MKPADPLTAAETGVILGLSARTVIRRAEVGELPFLRKLPGPNGDYLFERAVVLRYAAELATDEQARAAAAS